MNKEPSETLGVEQWEALFDLQFPALEWFDGPIGFSHEDAPKFIKIFIKATIATAIADDHKRTLNQVELMKRTWSLPRTQTKEWISGYNTALSEIRNLLTNKD